ncbi:MULTISPECIES: hypothetical protein [Pseudomonas]|uniref:Uncharacterized protein n=1 Tax=Pseudomonas neustonica TaxID=2487346 RepID=A0ABX9XFC3_9PSED|nr:MULTISPECIES: hypothetical protein [Pseudomonas]MAB25939.1 hypothetical protein [Pseudomonadales bacterium]MBA6419130.1 hypothetical protein [Pseudomonas sp. 5Ae-yellow]ROZ80015.1 hypothetical protein EF099_19305 [Pseudomonas sp. SSM44]ROZ80651.1 hypothetical protein EF096_19230 [Pseudomonas neustonica]|tara:strand:- start:1271 stop:1483 length:213 start_codon:yes stop_codon:yes gene_type:complete
MKWGAGICLLLFVAGGLLAIAQIWFALLSPDAFFKVLITLGILFVISLGVTLVTREYLQDKELRTKGFID